MGYLHSEMHPASVDLIAIIRQMMISWQRVHRAVSGFGREANDQPSEFKVLQIDLHQNVHGWRSSDRCGCSNKVSLLCESL